MKTGFSFSHIPFFSSFRSFFLIGFFLLNIITFTGIYSFSVTVDGSSSSTNPTPVDSNSLRSAYSIDSLSSHLNLSYSTFFGGNSTDQGNSIAVDSAGDVCVTGSTNSPNFPIKAPSTPTPNASNDPDNAFVSKFNSSGGLIYSTILGGSYYDYGSGVTADSQGNCYVVGYTESSDFPIKNASHPLYSFHVDSFLSKFSPSGALVFSTFLDGNFSANSVTTDSADNIYVTGNFYNSTSGFGEPFVTKFNTTGFTIFNSYLIANASSSSSIAVDSAGNIFITGTAYNSAFTTKNAFDASYGGNNDGFVAKFDSSGKLIFSTFLGGNGYDVASGIAVNSNGNCFVTGQTSSSDFPIKNSSNPTPSSFNPNVFLTEFNSSGDLILSTLFGGSNVDTGSGVAIDGNGNVYVTGTTNSIYFPMLHNYNYPYSLSNFNSTDKNDVFITKFNATGSMVFSSFVGGSYDDYGNYIAVDSTGNSYIIGYTDSLNFPTLNAYNSSYSGSDDVFVAKFYAFPPPSPTGPLSSNQTSFTTTNSSTNPLAVFLNSSIAGLPLPFLLLGGLVVLAVLFLGVRQATKHKKQSNQKKSLPIDSNINLKPSNNSNNSYRAKKLSDKSFELLDEIEKENKPDS